MGHRTEIGSLQPKTKGRVHHDTAFLFTTLLRLAAMMCGKALPFRRPLHDLRGSASDGGTAAEHSPETAGKAKPFRTSRGHSPGDMNGDPLNRAPGNALCPERFDEAALEKIRQKLGSYSFSALYQQRPIPLEGGLLKRSWFTKVVDSAPDELRWHRGYDLAVSTKTSADYTASFRCARDATGNIYIADGFRARIEYPDQRRFILERMRDEKNTVHGVEEALHGKAIVQDIHRERLAGQAPLRSIRVDSDKVTRALVWAALAEAGKIFLVRGRWIDEFLDEVCSFPNGRHDDQVDAVSLAVNMTAEKNSKAHGF